MVGTAIAAPILMVFSRNLRRERRSFFIDFEFCSRGIHFPLKKYVTLFPIFT
jgi:hypothetical protein